MPRCTYCAGWGQVEEYDPYSRHPEDYIVITCPKCRGSGLAPDDCDDDAFDALCNLPERELETYAGVALEADAETMEV